MIEPKEIFTIAEKVNRMNYDQIRLRIKAIDKQFPDLSFTETIELQYLTMKIITAK